ncbi:MAG: cell division protein FtsA [Candidatus Omnitrophota bacterium]
MLYSYICSLDIGASKIAACVAEMKGKRPVKFFFETAPSKGVKDGSVFDSISLITSISKLMKSLKSKSGINIKHVYANISGPDIVTKHSRAIIPLAERGNKVVTISDIRKVNEQARTLGSSLEEEIIHQVPFGYGIDSRSNIANPLGLYSHRLESDLYLISGKLSSVQSLERVISQAALEMRDLFFSGMATSKAVFGAQYNKGNTLLCDIGSDITEILIFKDAALRGIEILRSGADVITRKLEEELKISFELAEDVKRSHGQVGDLSHIPADKEILIKKEDSYLPISQQLVGSIINSSAKSVCQQIREAAQIKADSNLIDNFVVVGRGVLLDGFLECLENILGIPVKIGRIADPGMADWAAKDDNLSGQRYLTYLTCLGMIKLALAKDTFELSLVTLPEKNLLSRVINRAKEVYQEYF